MDCINRIDDETCEITVENITFSIKLLDKWQKNYEVSDKGFTFSSINIDSKKLYKLLNYNEFKYPFRRDLKSDGSLSITTSSGIESALTRLTWTIENLIKHIKEILAIIN